MSRRTLVQSLMASTSAMVVGVGGGAAQTGPAAPPSTITNPPRDFGPHGAPTTYFFDELDPPVRDAETTPHRWPSTRIGLASIDPTPVRMAHDYLNEAGIESFVFDTASSRMLGTTAGVPVRLMVHRDAAKDARDRLNDLGFTEK